MTTKEFKYNSRATQSHFAANFTSRIGDGRGEHEADYNDTLRLLFEIYRGKSLLDVGCGMGRILEFAAESMGEMVGIEPDPKRAGFSANKLKSRRNCTVHNKMTSKFIAENPGQQFDMVTVSMVIQHVSTNTCIQILRNVSTLLKADGLAVIATTLVPESAKGFSYQHSTIDEQYVPKDEFNHYADNPDSQDKGIPVRRFTEDELRELVSPSFDILHWRQFSYLLPEKVEIWARKLQVDEEEIRDAGISQLVVLRKKSLFLFKA